MFSCIFSEESNFLDLCRDGLICLAQKTIVFKIFGLFKCNLCEICHCIAVSGRVRGRVCLANSIQCTADEC